MSIIHKVKAKKQKLLSHEMLFIIITIRQFLRQNPVCCETAFCCESVFKKIFSKISFIGIVFSEKQKQMKEKSLEIQLATCDMGF